MHPDTLTFGICGYGAVMLGRRLTSRFGQRKQIRAAPASTPESPPGRSVGAATDPASLAHRDVEFIVDRLSVQRAAGQRTSPGYAPHADALLLAESRGCGVDLRQRKGLQIVIAAAGHPRDYLTGR